MHIPKSFKLRKSIWKVSFDPKQIDTSIYMGQCDTTKHKIFIDPELTRNELEETFVHELLHACFPPNICNDAVEEQIVSKMSKVLYQALIKNKRLLER